MGIRSDRAIWEAESEGLELIDLTIGDLLDQQAASRPDYEAVVYRYPELGLDLRLTHREYRDEVNRLAKGLLALGIEKGEHVAVWATNVPEWLMLMMALAKIGAVMVTVNTNYRAAELEYALRQGDVSTLAMIAAYRDNSFLDAIHSVAPELKNITNPAREELRCANLPRLKRVILVGDTPQAGLLPYSQAIAMGGSLSDEALQARQSSVALHDVAQIQYTSGTTGVPKGAMLTHHGVVNNALLSSVRWGIAADDRLVTPMPFFHVAGCILHALGALTRGATLIPMIVFDPAKQLELIAAERATYSGGVPTMLIAMLNHPRFQAGEFDLSSLRQIGSGGSPVPVVLMEQVKARMGADVAIVFGQTEASPIITQTLPSDSFELKSATVGIPQPHTEVKIVNTQTGEPAGFGEAGELLARGYLVMKGYYKMPDKTAETIDADGWLHTGDLATMNEKGHVNIVGRVKEMAIRGGENLFPAEIEAFLMRHPKVAEAQVVGVPDAFMGEELCALVRLKLDERADEEELREYCRANISRQKVPKYIRFVTGFPLTASGKVKKFELREQLIKELGLEDVARLKTA